MSVSLTSPPSVTLRAVSKRFGNTPVVDGVDHDFTPGLTAIIGSSGVGKSTLLHMIAGLLPPDGGLARIGRGCTRYEGDLDHEAFLQSKVALIHQDQNLLAHLDVLGNVELARRISEDVEGLREDALDALKRVGLASKASRPVTELSGGERQRVAIARTLCSRPKTILADEPTGSLDPDNSREVMKLLRAAADEGKTVIVVTHDPDLAREFCDTVLEFDGRRLMRERLMPAHPTESLPEAPPVRSEVIRGTQEVVS